MPACAQQAVFFRLPANRPIRARLIPFFCNLTFIRPDICAEYSGVFAGLCMAEYPFLFSNYGSGAIDIELETSYYTGFNML